MSERTVFISYRRDPTGRAFAGRIHDALRHQGYDVFLDVKDLASGPWARQILSEVPKRAHYLLVLTPTSLDRCADPNDWLRREYELAVDSKRNIVPIYEESLDVASLRAAAPAEMQSVFNLQMLELRHVDFDNTIERLVTHFISPHQAPDASDPKKDALSRPSSVKKSFAQWLSTFLRSTLADRMLDLLVIAAAILSLVGDATGNLSVFAAPTALALKGLSLLSGFPDEVRPLAEVALIATTCGIVLILLHAKSGGKLELGKWPSGLASSAFGIGIAVSLTFLRGRNWQRQRTA